MEKDLHVLTEMPKQQINEGMAHLQARMYKTIHGTDEEQSNMGFDAAGLRLVGIADLEAWAKAKHSYDPDILWNEIKHTVAFMTGESSYIVLVDKTIRQVEGYVTAFVGTRHPKNKWGAQSSGGSWGAQSSGGSSWNATHKRGRY